ncbi:reverse transcriptase domain-containing protein [Tanacetum coccineum]|uniref:Reverse transcriptase domain-containing protein n=1 Tax=Tanacetum coccineum TaxID=301880 RepID=A0ABQ5C9I9_9ASTR
MIIVQEAVAFTFQATDAVSSLCLSGLPLSCFSTRPPVLHPISGRRYPRTPEGRRSRKLLQQIGTIRGTQLLNYHKLRMTGPISDPTTPVNRVDTNEPNDSPNIQEQILNHISSLKALVQLHNESPTGSVKPIRLTFDDEEQPAEKLEEPEDLRKPYKEVLKSPFSRQIIEFSAPNHRMPTNLRIYDGSTDPDDHITRFVGATNQGEWEMLVWCRMFQQTLDGPTRGWFDRLPNGCIDNWTYLREAFVERFALRRKCCKDPTEVSKIIRKANETLPDFKKRWTEEMSYIPDVPTVMQISSFMSNSKCPELARRFSDQVPKTVTKMMKRVDDFVKSDEVFKNTELPKGEFPERSIATQHRGSRPPRHSYRNGPSRMDAHPKRDHYQSYVPPRAPDRRYDNRRHDHRRLEVNHLRLDSLTKLPSEILATELQLQLPPCPPTVAPPKKENLDRYCEYHGEKGHYTNDCFHLKKQLEVALESGKLNHLIKDVRQRGNNRGRPAGNNNGRGRVINMVHRSGKSLKRKSPYKQHEEWMNGIATLCARTEPVYECRWSDRKITEQETIKEKVEERLTPEGEERVLVNPAFPEQTITIESRFSAECHGRLIRLLKDNMDVFAWQPSDMAGIPKRLVRHALNVNNSVPLVAQKRRVLGTEKSQVVAKEVEEWVRAGIVKPVKYPTWISNPVLVKKVDDTWRMCIDFKNLNTACPKDYYPLPEIDLKIEAVMGYPFKCFLDAYKGYHQIQMSEEDEEKTAFYTDQGTYCYLKMPFGLKNAGATYQRLVDSAFQAQLGRNLEAYVDDMVIKSKTEQDMIIDIAETFDNLRRINMKLNPMKCSSGVGEGKFLGYMVTLEGIRANPKKTKAIADMQSPKTLKEMQSLSGKLAALNQFLSRFAERSLPFFEMLKNITKERKDEYRWTEEAERAFQKLKRLILELPTLTTPEEKETLYVYLATSREAVSGVLVANRNGKQTPIRYVSRTLHEAERNYAPLEKLALCLLHLSRRLRRYFEAHPIQVITDQPIKQILNKPEVSGKLAKYAVELGAYNIAYIPRTSVKGQGLDVKVDSKLAAYQMNGEFVASSEGMAKYLAKAKEELLLNAKSVDVEEVSTIVEEEGRNWMTSIIECPEKGIWSSDENEARSLRMKIGQYVMEDGVLFKKSYLSPMLRCVGPLQANYIIREVHEGACGMHTGARSVVAKIMRQGYYWPSMHGDTKEVGLSQKVPENSSSLSFGLQRVIITDNGTQLVNDPFKSWCEKWKIKQMNTAVAHPQANGLVERANKSLMHGLKARLGRERVGWVDELPNILWAHCTMLKTSNGETPFSLTYGSEAVIPTEIGMPTYRTLHFNEAQNEEEIRLNLDLSQERRETAAIREAKYKKKVEQYYNKRV